MQLVAGRRRRNVWSGTYWRPLIKYYRAWADYLSLTLLTIVYTINRCELDLCIRRVCKKSTCLYKTRRQKYKTLKQKMPNQHGRLKPEDEYKIRVHYVEIKSNIDGKEFTDEFFSKGVFTLDDMEEIDRETTRLARAELFLGKLFHSGPDSAYDAFIEVVNEKYPGLSGRFKEKIPTSEYPSKYYSWFDTVRDERRAKIPTDKELSDLAQCFIFNWQNAYLDLGFTSGELEQGYIRLKENAHAQMTQHLVTLKNKNSAFTFKYLIDKLVNLEKGGNTFFDWDTIKAIVNEDNPARLVS